ncbi:acyltransferase [Tunturibacter empetritectus]|uniref:Acyltransferase n=1 Tax=Tunturiibacter empetritectus TaxID=3069691 RepID=A0AAU7ZCC5_9BACT
MPINSSAMPLSKTPHQIEGLQIWRAIAVILVAALHLMQVMGGSGSLTMVRFGNLGMFGVDIFFVISGFILGLTALRAASGDARFESLHFISRRILRILPIYWIVILFPLTRWLRSSEVSGFTFLDFWFLLPGLSYPRIHLIIGLAWTLIFEMFFYYVLTVFLRITLRDAVRNTIAALVLLVVAGQFLGIRRSGLVVVMNPILLEFVMGNITALGFQRFGRQRKAGVAMLVAGVIAAGLVTFYTSTNVALEQNVLLGVGMLLRVGTWGIAAWLLVSGVVFWGPQVRSRLGKMLVAIGDGSYSIYLTSAISTEMISRLMARIPIEFLRSGPLVLREGIALVCVILTGMVCFWFVETPLLRWLNGRYKLISARRRVVPAPVIGV